MLEHLPVWPMHIFSQLNGIWYTTSWTHGTNSRPRLLILYPTCTGPCFFIIILFIFTNCGPFLTLLNKQTNTAQLLLHQQVIQMTSASYFQHYECSSTVTMQLYWPTQLGTHLSYCMINAVTVSMIDILHKMFVIFSFKLASVTRAARWISKAKLMVGFQDICFASYFT